MANLMAAGVDNIRRGFRWRQNESAKLWYRRYQYGDFATAATTLVKDVTNFPGGAIIEGAYIALIQNFTGGGNATATFSAGTTGSATAYINAVDVFTGAAAFQPLMRAGATLVPGTPLNATNPAAAATVRFTLTTSVNTNLVTAGILDVFLKLTFIALKPTVA